MKYKKFITIALVAALLCASLPVVVGGRSTEVKETNTIRALQDSFSNLINKIFNKFPTLSALFKRFIPVEPHEPGTPETPQPPQQPIVLDFQIYLSDREGVQLEEFKLDEIIYVTAVITNEGKTAVSLDEMNVHFRTLDYFITTPEKYIIHCVGVFIPTFPEPETIEVGGTCKYTIALNEKGDNIDFGIIPVTDSVAPGKPILYEEFVKGEYTIYGQYTSNLDPSYIPPVSSSLASEPLVFNGQLKSREVGFVILG